MMRYLEARRTDKQMKNLTNNGKVNKIAVIVEEVYKKMKKSEVSYVYK